MSAIPIANLYYVLGYAWDFLEEADELDIQAEKLPTCVDLLTRILTNGTQRLLRRGVDSSYIPQIDVLTTLRGRVDFTNSARRLLLRRGRAICHYEEFLPDLLHNQILKSTACALLSTDVDARQRLDLTRVLRRMEGIRTIEVRPHHFRHVRLHRNNAHYRLLMQVCELVWLNLLASEEEGDRRFRDFTRDEGQMARLFEAFIANFYAKETAWHVSPQQRIHWKAKVPSALLPEMRADAVLRRGPATIIVECKYYQETLQAGRWNSSPKLRSGHLYQLSAYLSHLDVAEDEANTLMGLLIYPTVGQHVEEELWLGEQHLRAATVDLDKPWHQIQTRLISLTGG